MLPAPLQAYHIVENHISSRKSGIVLGGSDGITFRIQKILDRNSGVRFISSSPMYCPLIKQESTQRRSMQNATVSPSSSAQTSPIRLSPSHEITRVMVWPIARTSFRDNCRIPSERIKQFLQFIPAVEIFVLFMLDFHIPLLPQTLRFYGRYEDDTKQVLHFLCHQNPLLIY